jgi:redox-sensitive bicupin YhaK (pirin superfamily)
MIERVSDARAFDAGLLRAALAAPLDQDGQLRMVGPFVVVAHVLPLRVEPGALPPDCDVRPHPHIGLVAITYMLDGHVTHRDSLGSRVEIGPGGLNCLVAGRGVVHSERFERIRLLGGTLELLQILIALPDGAEEAEPTFDSTASVPAITEEGATIRWLAPGSKEVGAPVRFPAPILLCDVQLPAGARFRLPEDVPERAAYVIDGAIEVDGTRIGRTQVVRFAAGPGVVDAREPARILVFGGEPSGPRTMWWNFIHSSMERIDAAKAAWRAGETPLPPGDTESFTPAPPDDGRPLHRLTR